MSNPDPSSSEPGRMNQSIRSRLPGGNGANLPPTQPPYPPVLLPMQLPEDPRPSWVARFLPAFWTIASVISLFVNVVLFIALLIALQMLGTIQTTANDQASGLLGGLYQNFAKMDQATISRTIPVDANIPLNMVVPVNTTTSITLAEDTVLRAHVRIDSSIFKLNAPDTMVTLYAGQPLRVNVNFPLNVQNTIPVHLDVPVNIPLRETQLHEPFVGLRQLVQPWLCMVQPEATYNAVQICSPFANPVP